MGNPADQPTGHAEVASESFPSAPQPATQPIVSRNAAEEDGFQERPALPQPTVASLLSQLQNSPAIHALTSGSHVVQSSHTSSHVPSYIPVPRTDVVTDPRLARRVVPPAVPKQDLRGFTFQQTLPIIAQLSEDDAFVQAVRKVRGVARVLSR